MKNFTWTFLAGLALASLSTGATHAQENYFNGKTILIHAGSTVGGGIDTEVRLNARFFGDFIPGHPVVQPRNMPGGGGLTLAAHLYSIATPDGLTLGMPSKTSFVLPALTGDPAARFDLDKFAWIGSAATSNYLLWLRRDLNIPTLDALRRYTRELSIGGTGLNSGVMPDVLAKYERLPMKAVRGYPGSTEIMQAIERQEVDGYFGPRASVRQDLIDSGFLVPVLQTFPIEKDLPAIENFAAGPEAKGVYSLFNAPLKIGLPLLAPPATPPQIVAILRDAYVKMASSAEYQDTATKLKFDVGQPTSGAELEAYAREKLATVSESVIKEYRALVERK